MASQYLDETQGRRKAHLGLSPLTLAGAGVLGAYGLGAVDSYAKPNYMGLPKGAAYTPHMFNPSRQWKSAYGRTARWARSTSANINTKAGELYRGLNKLSGMYPGNWKSTGTVGFYSPANYNLASTIRDAAWGGVKAVGRGSLQGINAAGRGISTAYRGIMRGGAAINQTIGMGLTRASMLPGQVGRGIGRGFASLKNAVSGPITGSVTIGGSPALNMGAPFAGDWSGASKFFKAAFNKTYATPRLQTIGSMFKRGAINTAKLPFMGIGALGGSKALTIGGMGVAAGLGIWAGASMALLSFMPYSAQQGGATRGTRVMGAAAPTFTASRGPMSPNNLATNGLTQGLYNTRHGQR
jgi:hypothetical protein